MAMSEPTLQGVDVPNEAPPNNTFQVEITVKQGGPDPIASDGNCTTRNLDIGGWQTPVNLYVDGEKVASRELCLAPENKRTFTLSASISETGNHSVRVEVLSVGGNAYDLTPRKEQVNDDITGQITVATDASDPSKPGIFDSFKKMLDGLADELGATTTTLGAGMGLMVILLVVV